MAYLILCKATGTGSFDTDTAGIRTLAGSNTHDYLTDVATFGSSVYVSGYTPGSGAGGDDAFIAKYRVDGTIQWQRTLGGTSNDWGEGITTDSSGNVYMIGFTNSEGTNSSVFVAKYNSNGTLLWQKILSGSGAEYGRGIATDVAGNVYISGWTSTGTSGGDDVYLAKLTSAGALVWQRVVGTSFNEGGAYNMVLDQSGNIYLYGSGYDGANWDEYLIKYDTDGNYQWDRRINDSGNANIEAGVGVDSSGNAYVAMRTHNDTAGYIFKFNSSGTLQWQREIDSGSSTRPHSVYVDGSDNVFIGGYESANNAMFVLKYNTSGVLQSQITVAGVWNVVTSIIGDSYGNIYGVGETRPGSYWNMFLAKITDGMTLPTTIGSYTYQAGTMTESAGSQTIVGTSGLTDQAGSLSLSTSTLTDQVSTLTETGSWE